MQFLPNCICEHSCSTLRAVVLTSKMSGKVYRAQVKPVKRSHMIPMSNGNGTGPCSTTTSMTIKSNKQNGEPNDHSMLSSSLDKEKK